MPIAGKRNYRHNKKRALFCAALAGGCAIASATASAAGAPMPDAGDDAAWRKPVEKRMQAAADGQAARLQYRLLVAEIALGRDQLAEAARQYAAALALAPSAPLAERTARVAAAAKRPDLAYDAVKTWIAADPLNAEAIQAAVRLALMNDDAAGIARYVPALAGLAENPREGYEQAAHLLGGEPSHADAALAGLQQVAKAHPDQPGASYALALAAFGYDKLDIAAQAVARVRKAAPDWLQPGLMAAAIDVRQGHTDAAQKTVASLGGDPKARAHNHLALAHLLLQAGEDDPAAEEFRAVLKVAPDNADAHFGLGLVSLSQGKLDPARQHFKAVAGGGDHADDAAFYLGVIAERQKRTADAKRWYGQVDSGGHVFEAGVRRAVLAANAGHLDKALDALDALASSDPDHAADIVGVKGDLLVQAGQPKQALALFNQAMSDHPEAGELRYGRALVYEKLGRIDDAEADLRRMIDDDGDDARALNALGYLLTEHTDDYARAEKLIRRALDNDAGDPAILDSLGWVQYKRGALAAARKNLEKAWSGNDDPEIAAHLGAVRWALGDHQGARAVWQKAAKAHPDNETLQKMMETHSS